MSLRIAISSLTLIAAACLQTTLALTTNIRTTPAEFVLQSPSGKPSPIKGKSIFSATKTGIIGDFIFSRTDSLNTNPIRITRAGVTLSCENNTRHFVELVVDSDRVGISPFLKAFKSSTLNSAYCKSPSQYQVTAYYKVQNRIDELAATSPLIRWTSTLPITNPILPDLFIPPVK